MNVSFSNAPRRRALILTGFAALMGLCWWAGREAGKHLTAHTSARETAGLPSSGALGSVRAKAPAAPGPDGGQPVTTEATAALMKNALLRRKENQNVPSGTFTGCLQQARLLRDLFELSIPQQLALIEALHTDDSPEAKELADSLMSVLAVREPARLWRWVRDGAAAGNPALADYPFTVSIFSQWASHDAHSALNAWNAEVQPLVQAGKMSPFGLGEIYRCLMVTEPEAAVTALEKVSDPATRQMFCQSAALSLGKLFEGEIAAWPNDADALVNRMLALLPADSGRSGVEGIMRARLARQSPQEAAAWADTLTATPEQRVFIDKTIADPWMSRDPAAAASWFVDRVTARDPEGRAKALERCMQKWTSAGDQSIERDNRRPPDLAAASDWLIAQGLNAQSQTAMAALARAWAEAREPAAALAWAQALPEETARNAAIQTVSQEIRQRFPNDWQRLTGSAPAEKGQNQPAASADRF